MCCSMWCVSMRGLLWEEGKCVSEFVCVMDIHILYTPSNTAAFNVCMCVWSAYGMFCVCAGNKLAALAGCSDKSC